MSDFRLSKIDHFQTRPPVIQIRPLGVETGIGVTPLRVAPRAWRLYPGKNTAHSLKLSRRRSDTLGFGKVARLVRAL